MLEFVGGRALSYDDHNDGGETGFGILTNEPPFPWHLAAVRHLEWKRALARPAVDMPGSWYPDARFQRLHLVKTAMPTPASYREAVMQAVHVLNTVTVPMGSQMGTDSGVGEGLGDHTQWGLIYDSKNQIIYWRSEVNQNFQRLRLQDAGLARGGREQVLAVYSPELLWFSDAASALSPRGPEEAVPATV